MRSYAEWCGEIDDEATLRRAVSLFEDILLDIADWEDKAMAEAIEINRDALQSMIDVIRLRGGDTPPRTRTLGDELMDCADRLGSEADSVHPDVWKHLLPHAPTNLLESVARLRVADAGAVDEALQWVRKAYRGDTFTVWNMQVAYCAGRASAPPEAAQPAAEPGAADAFTRGHAIGWSAAMAHITEAAQELLRLATPTSPSDAQEQQP